MIPVVTPIRMSEIDAAASESAEDLIEKAGAATAQSAMEIMGGRYGRRVVIVSGPGNNGADGRAAAHRLQRAGVRVSVVSALDAPEILPAADLYIDAAFGTGLSRSYSAPKRACEEAPVLAVDIPSGIDGLTGEVMGGPVWPAGHTVTFAALKPGLLFNVGSKVCGAVTVADIGLKIESGDSTGCALLEDTDVEPLPVGSHTTHKWGNAVLVVAGSVGMGGAAALVCDAAQVSGARLVRLNIPVEASRGLPVEVVHDEPPLSVDAARFKACAVGPGLGRDSAAVTRFVDALRLGLPTVIDADAMHLMHDPAVAEVMSRRRERMVPTVFTPHDVEFEALTGHRPGVDRIAAARAAATEWQATVLLKGGPTVVANHDGRVRVISCVSPKLAAAGTGDVLAGVIAGRVAAFGVERIFECVAEAAHLHGRASEAIQNARLVASDLISALRQVTR